MNTESFLSLRTFKKFFVFLSFVKVFFLFLGFVFHFSLYFDIQLQAVVYLHVIENLYITVMALAYQNGDYMGSLNKKASGAQCFIMALGLFWDIVTGLP